MNSVIKAHLRIHTIVYLKKNVILIWKTFFIVKNAKSVIKAYKKIFTTVKNVSNVMKVNKKIHFIVINVGNAILDKRKIIIIAKNVIFALKN